MALSKTYNPSEHEADIYKLWENAGAFKPAGDPKKEPFSIILPPPNANGSLHTGHAMYTVEDILTRYHRMKGQPTLWLPGTDHAGIETQVVFERELAKDGKSRFDFSREEFYQRTWDFTMKNQQNMLNQMKQLGFSMDWSKLKFTLDSDIIEIVYSTFKQMHDDGLIYRGERIVNWCPHCRAAFADIEVKYQERIDPLYYLKYGPFVLATARPETKFGDTAVAVNSKDERYTQYVGKEIEVEGLLGKFKIKVIADNYVDPDFGTGVIKVTPAHDPNDWEIGLRHGLEIKQVIGTDGRLTDIAGKYAGMTVDDARTQVAHDLEERGLIDHIEMDYKHNVAVHDRCGTVIEPLVTEQWWVKVESLTGPAIKAIESDEIRIIPAHAKRPTLEWLKNLRDWNISRQIVWGIRIPVFYRADDDETKRPYLITSNETEAEKYYGKGNYEAEIDTFDTWFSSSQWPFATLQTTGDFDQFYPTSVLDTGRDIRDIWVTRMIMMGLYRTGKVPFRTVYLHGMVTDEYGKKMSKSKGNVINPLELTAKYGTDALRLALTIGISPGNDGELSDRKVAGYRNFCNKLWNVARFILNKVSDCHPELDLGSDSIPGQARNDNKYSPATPDPQSLADQWILSRLSETTTSATAAIDKFDFSAAGQAVYSLLWDDFADWYIEASKVGTTLDVLVYGLETILKLLHPFAPFITETIWQEMPWHKDYLITSTWPTVDKADQKSADLFEQIRLVVLETRSLICDLGLVKPRLVTSDQDIVDQSVLIAKLSGALVEQSKEGRGLPLTTAKLSAWLDIDADKIAQRLDDLKKQKQFQASRGERASQLLKNSGFSGKASAEAKQLQTEIVAEAKLLTQRLDEQIAKIAGH